jgi:superfamily II DNA/RNA helicase
MALLIGGVQMGDQVKALDEGVDVLIATPGRLMDLFERGKILLNGCDLLVIDEADRMLDMGFIPDIEFICEKLPTQRQTLLFSATMPPPIKRLADKFLTNPKSIEVARAATANVNIAQFKVEISPRKKKQALKYLLEVDNVTTAIIFANRKTTVRELNKDLQKSGFKSGEIHGDMDQSSRIAELELFKKGEINILVASDVAARGLDIKGVSHVFNYDTPWHPDDYIHRIGRTGRAGAKGRSITLVTPEDREALENVEKLTKIKVPPFDWSSVAPAQEDRSEPERREERDEKPKRSSRKKDGPKSGEKAKSEDDAKSEDKAKRPPRKENVEAAPRTEKRERKPRREDNEPPSKPGEWNGPMPGFLGVGFD